jgi:probable HAF family extracellular repeat protein
LLVALSVTARAVPAFTAVQLAPQWPTSPLIDMSCLNDAGQMAGAVATTTGSQMALFSAGRFQYLGAVGEPYIMVHELNELGDACGTAYEYGQNGLGRQRACVSRIDRAARNRRTLVALPTDVGSWSVAFGLNDRGEIAGITWVPDHEPHAVVWGPNGRRFLKELDPRGSRGWKINNLGTVLGMCYTAMGEYHATLWHGDRITDMGTLGGPSSNMVDINDLDAAVGYSRLADGHSVHGFIYRRGVMTDLGTLGGDRSVPSAMNDSNWVVGYSTDGAGDRRAFLWENGAMHDLSSLMPPGFDQILVSVLDINDRGQILALSFADDGWYDYRLFLLTPVGSPALAIGGIESFGK